MGLTKSEMEKLEKVSRKKTIVARSLADWKYESEITWLTSMPELFTLHQFMWVYRKFKNYDWKNLTRNHEEYTYLRKPQHIKCVRKTEINNTLSVRREYYFASETNETEIIDASTVFLLKVWQNLFASSERQNVIFTWFGQFPPL